MADAEVLPYDDVSYGNEIVSYIDGAKREAATRGLKLDFAALHKPRLAASPPPAQPSRHASRRRSLHPELTLPLNQALRAAETALLNPAGLPQRSWFKHTVYAPGEFTGYAAVVIPGVNEGIDAADAARTQSQIGPLTAALNRSAAVLEQAAK